MIEKLAELNRVLLAVNELRDADGVADTEVVIESCKGTVIEARIPEHGHSIEFAGQIGLLAISGKAIRLTDEGLSFIELNPSSQYDLSEEQKRVLLRTCYLHGALRKEAMSILKVFSPGLGTDVFRWSLYDSPALPNEWTAEHLSQLGLLERRDDGWEVRADYTKTVAEFLGEGEGWSEESFREYLREREEVGKLSENLIKGYEVRRLMGLGHAVEARCVRRISNLRVNAGYDIESFDSSSPAMAYDRFIEVKGARGPQMRFFWTDNEIKVARKLGKRYWIYFQGAIDVAKGSARDEPILVNDPVNSISENGKFRTTPQGLIVESDMRGKPITA
jgi:Protein NO VEIN, C-terminal